jgi:FMN phosphatase YigB (HAD superfamily)/ribosome-binding protein aMBF1 (putative translation factor)
MDWGSSTSSQGIGPDGAHSVDQQQSKPYAEYGGQVVESAAAQPIEPNSNSTTPAPTQPVEAAQGIEPEKTLGRKLQEARQKAGLTQQELCQKAGLSYSTLAKIERGAIKSPSIFTIQQIAGVLGTSLDMLIGGHPSAGMPVAKKYSASGVSFVFFDINGCLVRFFHRAFTKLAQDINKRPDEIETAFWHYNDAVCRGEMTLEAFDKALSDKVGVSNLKWEDYYLAAVTPIEEMQELVKWAATQYDVGLISNIMPGMIDALKQKGLIPDVPYAAVIDSSQVGAVKPEPKIYEAATAAANRPASEILLVDDSRANLMPAGQLGWHVLWFDDYDPEESVKRVKAVLELAP